MNAFQSLLTPVTHNIPSILREPAEALIGQRCYHVLVYDLDVTDGECLKYALSKGLGLGIVLGGAIVKIPQIIKIVQSGSARGLSLSAYILETLSYAVSLAYSSRNKFPFSTYGENFFLTIQNVVITLLILYFSAPKGGSLSSKKSASPDSRAVTKVVGGIAIAVTIGAFLWSENLCSLSSLGLLQAATLPISLLSKAPQIMSNYRARSTGNLSAFAVFNALLGCLARVFTTKQEVNDPLIFWGFVGAAVLNLVLATQMIMYWSGEDDRTPIDVAEKRGRRATEDGLLSDGPAGGGGVKRGVEDASGRRWARKLD